MKHLLLLLLMTTTYEPPSPNINKGVMTCDQRAELTLRAIAAANGISMQAFNQNEIDAFKVGYCTRDAESK